MRIQILPKKKTLATAPGSKARGHRDRRALDRNSGKKGTASQNPDFPVLGMNRSIGEDSERE